MRVFHTFLTLSQICKRSYMFQMIIENLNQTKIDIKINFTFLEAYLWLFDHCVTGFFSSESGLMKSSWLINSDFQDDNWKFIPKISKFDIKIDFPFSEGNLWLFDHCVAGPSVDFFSSDCGLMKSSWVIYAFPITTYSIVKFFKKIAIPIYRKN